AKPRTRSRRAREADPPGPPRPRGALPGQRHSPGAGIRGNAAGGRAGGFEALRPPAPPAGGGESPAAFRSAPSRPREGAKPALPPRSSLPPAPGAAPPSAPPQRGARGISPLPPSAEEEFETP